MNMREFSRSRIVKVMVVALCVIAIKFRDISSESVVNNAPWFKQNLTAREVDAMLYNNASRIDETYKGEFTGDNNDGLTGLMYHIKAGYPENARAFIRKGASLDMTAKNNKEMRAAASATRDESLNERYYRATALHMALMNANDDTNYQLAKDMILGIKRDDDTIAKANVQLKNGFGFTPLHTVVASIETDDYVNTTDITRNRRVEFIKLIMDAAGNKTSQEGLLNAQNEQGNTMLHILAQRNALNTIEWLISNYGRMLKLDIRNNPVAANNVGKDQYPQGMTPADIAYVSGYGAACAGRLWTQMKRYDDKSISEDDYKNNPKFNDIQVSPSPYNSTNDPLRTAK